MGTPPKWRVFRAQPALWRRWFSLFLARLLKHFLALPSGFFFLSRSRRDFSFLLHFPSRSRRSLNSLSSLFSLSSLLSLFPAHNVFFCLTHNAHRAHLHTSRLCVFLCVCVPNPRRGGGQPALGGAVFMRELAMTTAPHALTWHVFQEGSTSTWRVFPARPALHNIPKFTKFPNITILLNKLIVTTMHPL